MKSVLLLRVLGLFTYFSPLTTILLSVLFVYFVAFKWRRRRLEYLIEKLPGPTATPFIGNILEVATGFDGTDPSTNWIIYRKLKAKFYIRILAIDLKRRIVKTPKPIPSNGKSFEISIHPMSDDHRDSECYRETSLTHIKAEIIPDSHLCLYDILERKKKGEKNVIRRSASQSIELLGECLMRRSYLRFKEQTKSKFISFSLIPNHFGRFAYKVRSRSIKCKLRTGTLRIEDIIKFKDSTFNIIQFFSFRFILLSDCPFSCERWTRYSPQVYCIYFLRVKWFPLSGRKLFLPQIWKVHNKNCAKDRLIEDQFNTRNGLQQLNYYL